MIFPVDSSYYSGDTLGDLWMILYNNIDPGKTAEIANYLKNHAGSGNTVFYGIYTDDEKAVDLENEHKGLFFKGNSGERFTICNADGSFAYVGAM